MSNVTCVSGTIDGVRFQLFGHDIGVDQGQFPTSPVKADHRGDLYVLLKDVYPDMDRKEKARWTGFEKTARNYLIQGPRFKPRKILSLYGKKRQDIKSRAEVESEQHCLDSIDHTRPLSGYLSPTLATDMSDLGLFMFGKGAPQCIPTVHSLRATDDVFCFIANTIPLDDAVASLRQLADHLEENQQTIRKNMDTCFREHAPNLYELDDFMTLGQCNGKNAS